MDPEGGDGSGVNKFERAPPADRRGNSLGLGVEAFNRLLERGVMPPLVAGIREHVLNLQLLHPGVEVEFLGTAQLSRSI
ncbi:hypothetical protein [Roseateles sp.]|uniref:hypothetical protein n=1 Tax=Roseateles sp. TaxID=1971397 RepID=UPI00326623BE